MVVIWNDIEEEMNESRCETVYGSRGEKRKKMDMVVKCGLMLIGIGE